ncbi:outer membrane beta-barrel protein [Sphingomonas tabacisoli]|uniref:Outer membrane beta-barrel protein n=1 Tax=Sphingomonas tabacisoli TaxID=2249466 RepID=A0ABW4HY99_9SPHN
MDKRAWLALLLIGCGEAAIAQTTSPRPPVVGSPGRPNRGAPERHIGIRADVDVNYDSNVYGVSDQLAPTRLVGGRSKDDISITPSLQLDILLPLGRQSVFARGGIGYDFFTKNSELNRARINMDVGANLQVTNFCTTTIDGTYLRTRSNAGDVVDPVDGSVLRLNNTEEFKSIGARADCGSGFGISPGLGYRHSETRNSKSAFKFNDSNQDSFDGSIGYQRPTLGRLSIYGSYSTGEYLNRDILGLPVQLTGLPHDGVKSYSAGGRFERNIGSRISGVLSLGYSWVDPKAQASKKFRGSSYSAQINVIPTNRMSLDLLASRSAELSNTTFASFSITEVYALNGTYRLNPRIALNFGASQQTRDFRQTATAANPITNDKFTRFYGGFVYDLNRRIRLNGLVSQQHRGANDARFRYSNTTASLGVSLSLGR